MEYIASIEGQHTKQICLQIDYDID